MSITLANAKKFISKGLGGATSTPILDMAGEAILQGFEDWMSAKNWYFTLKDTSGGFPVSGVTLTDSTTVLAPTSGAFDGTNLFVGVSDSGGKVPAGAYISAINRSTDGTVASIVLSALPTAATGVTLIFTGDIPLVSGVQEYNLYTDFLAPYHLRMLGKRLPLDYIQYRYWNMKIIDHTIQGLPVAYTVYNPVSADTQNFGTYRMRVFRIPQGTLGVQYDTVTQQYYRKFNFTADPLDIPDRYLYKFLNYCQWALLSKKNATDERLPEMEKIAQAGLQSAMTDDEEICEEEEQSRIISQVEAGMIPRPLWSNSQFSLYYGEI